MHAIRAAFAIVLCCCAGWPAAAYAGAGADAFPQRPIRWIVPFPPGGSNDVLARYLGIKVAERIGEQVVIDNRGGANGVIGADLAAHSTPDGHTLLMVSTSYVMNAAVRKLPYDIEKSFDPVTTIATSPNCIVVTPTFANTLKELVERAKAKPKSVLYASTGVGGFNHVGGELFNKVASIQMTMVPYRGGGPAMTDVMAGQVPVMFSSVTQVLPHARSGKLKVLGVGAAKRSASLPDVPTVAEAGFPGYEVAVWWGVVVPTGVPAAPVQKLRREFTAGLEQPDTRKDLAGESAEPLVLTPPEFRKLVQEDLKKWKTIAREAQIKVE